MAGNLIDRVEQLEGELELVRGRLKALEAALALGPPAKGKLPPS